MWCRGVVVGGLRVYNNFVCDAVLTVPDVLLRCYSDRA